MKFILFILTFLTFKISISQNSKEDYFTGGVNIYTSTNKITAGINLMYVNKKSMFFYLNGNFGLTGYKKFDDLIYEKTDSFQVGNSNTYSYAYNITNYYSTPYDQNETISIPTNTNGKLNNYHAKIIGYFLNFSTGLPINRKKTFYIGANALYFWNIDNGNYSYTQNSPTKQIITNKIHAKFQTVGTGFFVAYMYHINKKISLLSQLNFNFYFPIINNKYGVSDGKNPLVGSEQDISISINYKL